MRPTDPRLRRGLRAGRGPLLVVVGSSVLAGVLVIAQAWAVTGLVLAAIGDPGFTGLLGGGVGGGGGASVARWAGVVLAVLALRGIVGAITDLASARAAGRVAEDLRRRGTRASIRLQAYGPAGADAPTGATTTLLTRGVAAAEPYLTRYVPALALATVLPALTMVAIATQDLLSAFIVVATLPLVPLFAVLVGMATRDRAAEQWRAMESLSGHFADVVRGLPTLVGFRRARAQSARIGDLTDRYRRASGETLKLAFASSAILELVATLSVALVAVTVGIRLAGDGLDLGTALVVLLLAPEAYWPLRRVGAEFHASAEGAETFAAIADLEDRAAGLAGLAGLAGWPGESGIGRPADLVVDGVSVTRPGRSRPGLASTSVVVPSRGVTAVVGPSGCGKSTLLAVLAGLLPPTTGEIRLGTQPVAGEAWRRQVALLPQRPVFLPGSIADNLRLAVGEGELVGDDRLWEVLGRVALADRVRALPQGLDSPVGEDATDLSAGERARLALARVLLSERPWVLLDEPTAHLDPVTTRVIADVVADLAAQRAVIVVAHRPELVDLADHVVRLNAPEPAPASAALAPPREAAPTAPGERADLAPERREERARDPLATPAKHGLAAATVLGGLASASGVALTATAGWLIVQASTHPPVLTLLVAVVSVRMFGIARPALRYVERLWSHDVALRLLARRRVDVYDALVPLTPGALGRRRGDLLAGVVDDVDAVVDAELRVKLPLRSYLIAWAVAVAFATAVLPAAGPVVALGGAVAPMLAFALARHGARQAEKRSVGARAETGAAVLAGLEAAAELEMWQRTDAAVAVVRDAGRRWSTAQSGVARALACGRLLVLLGTGVAMAAVAVIAADALADGAVSAPIVGLLVLLPLALGEVAAQVPEAGVVAARCAAAQARLDDLQRRAPRTVDPDQPAAEPVAGDVALDGVAVGWGVRPAVTDLDLALAPGERVALVGPSGSGKSTVAALLMRYLPAMAGSARLGGVELAALRADVVRERVGLVDDDPHLFASNVAENVRLARPEATDADVAAALRAARLGDWLDDLPDGLDTRIGDGHAQVSGGERARIAIARSVLADQPVLVLDEPVAHLDHATAEEVAAEVLGDAAGTGRSVLWITHEPVGLDRVDRVLELSAPRATPGAPR